jgi:Zn-dependent protease with chaperone function
MDFFAAQAASRRRTRWLLAGYALAVAAVVAAITCIVLVFAIAMADDRNTVEFALADHVGKAVLIALSVLGVIAIASLHRMSQLRDGGGAVARLLGGTQLTRETQDPKRRRLLNVVEEMAIASGVPVPEVYVLEQETSINAFAAGYAPTDAAIAVTRGTIERLNRAELQGVIGHEFSHVLNGDMRLNTRLAGPLFGLLVIAIAARHVLRGVRGSNSRKAGPFILAAFAVMVLGYLGVWLGRLLQSAICRQREFLADASSVQFTRDTTGLRDALVHIARGPRGSRLRTPEGEDLAHLFIAPAYQRFLATHPPLEARIRALDPRFDVKQLGVFEPDPDESGLDVESLADGSTPPIAGLAANARPDARVPVAPERLSATVGNPGLDAVNFAQALRVALPADLTAALTRGSTAACVWLAAGLSAAPVVRTGQLASIATRLGAPVAGAVEKLDARLRELPAFQRLPMLQRALPALGALPRERRLALIELQRELAAADGNIDVHEYLLGALAARYLADQVDPKVVPAGAIGLEDAAEELGVLFAALARAGTDSPVDARRAYERGLALVLPRQRPDFEPTAGADWASRLDRALARLDRLAPLAKESVIEGLARTVEHDGTVTVREAELLRAACAMLHCPLPPLLAGATA